MDPSQIAIVEQSHLRAVTFKGNEPAWRFVNGAWKTNNEGYIIGFVKLVDGAGG